jgi:hypothetical protein
MAGFSRRVTLRQSETAATRDQKIKFLAEKSNNILTMERISNKIEKNVEKVE